MWIFLSYLFVTDLTNAIRRGGIYVEVRQIKFDSLSCNTKQTFNLNE
jgi:hypothetical protein